MKKRVLTAFMAAVVALSAVGCASSDADPIDKY